MSQHCHFPYPCNSCGGLRLPTLAASIPTSNFSISLSLFSAKFSPGDGCHDSRMDGADLDYIPRLEPSQRNIRDCC
jgi:hypothetical protein